MTHPPEARYDRPPQAHAAPAPSPSAHPAGRLELDLDIDQTLNDLQRAFPGICIWHGEFVRHEALHFRVEVKDLYRPVVVAAGLKLGAALSGKCRSGRKAALTTTGRASTTGWPGSG